MTFTASHSRTGDRRKLPRRHSLEVCPPSSHPRDIRVVSLRPEAMPETPHDQGRLRASAKASGMTCEQSQEMLAESKTHPRRLMALEEMANVAAFRRAG
jgi:hypothetical protein